MWTASQVVSSAGSNAGPRSQASRVELHVTGRVKEISVSPSGASWLMDSDGPSYHADGFDALWSRSSLDCSTLVRFSRSGQCDRVTFFTDSVAIATGYVGQHNDEYFWTGDAGRTWERRKFPAGEWIYDVFATARGEAWMGGSRGSVYHSRDAGRTFTLLSQPYDNGSRMHRIFMTAGGHGIAGALGNELRVTRDGGRTWTAIATPLDQRPTSGAKPAEHSPEKDIQNVAFFNGQLVVQQNDAVFASPDVTPVRWRRVGTLVAFETDRDGSAAFGVERDGRFVRIDASLALAPIPGARLKGELEDLHVEGSVLYALDASLGLYRADAQGARFAVPHSEGDAAASLTMVRRAGDKLWGVTPHGLYASTDGGATWGLEQTSATALVGLDARNADELFLWNARGEASIFDARTRRLTAVRSLAGVPVGSLVVVDPGLWLVLDRARPQAGAWRSDDRGATWTPLDTWKGAPAIAAVVSPDHDVVLWLGDNTVRRLKPPVSTGVLAGIPAPRVRSVPVAPLHVSCCTSVYFADADHGLLRGYVHHLGDHVWATQDGGARWSEVDAATLPYRRIVPFRGEALAVAARIDEDDDGERELYVLQGTNRRLVYRATEQISDVSVDPSGNVLIELDPTPETFSDTSGRHWLALQPPAQ
ncbi:WD40/YVTN/BNR-like repeat-containing protein [Polyangium aurulentum]|uniref:WD40/YVTN/BNR-like repeat-containing protein n=1 Tax=Polyangium aurulentum TaxID=2567896 RepID=UPI00200DF60F|nr:hypothetical protein [Polyangium aurulentum]UQA60569.1 hypothetical protein E8A73_008885 [Polyangium aurulentum]